MNGIAQYLGESKGNIIQGHFYYISIKLINDKDGIKRDVAFVYHSQSQSSEYCIGALTYIPSDWRYNSKEPEIFKL